MFDSIRNINDFFSTHWLAEAFPAKLRDLSKDWKARADKGKQSPLQGLSSASAKFLTARASLPDVKDDSYLAEATSLHSLLLEAVGIHAERTLLDTEQAGTRVTIPLLARIQSPGSEALHVLQAQPVEAIDNLFAKDAVVLVPMQVHHSETKVEDVVVVSDVIERLFLTESKPRYLLVVAGGWVVLADVERWAEGRYLAFDVDTAMSRRDDKVTGELAWHAGLWSADVLLPADDGTTKAEEFARDSVKHAVGVSADLREGLRISVELIANAVIVARRQRGDVVEGDDDLPRDLTRQSLRFLYRILFLLYAESRPELGILPVGAPEYGAGYGLDRFREMVQRPLSTEQARNGTHLHDSLRLLFDLVNNGHDYGLTDHDGLVFEPLRADLFEPTKARLVDDINLPNSVLQEVLGLLLLSKADKKRARGYVSYAQLGINQLGAVYEGLMSYSGFIADRRLTELAKDGDADKGTWLVPAENIGHYDVKHVVRREDRLTGAKTNVTHAKGTFVYRLSGRDRQRSASYYTPEVLTHTVVKHALAELITEYTTAADILDYRICEPALGSGAFLNEAINQLARAYLDRRQEELKETIAPENFQPELQKVKAHLALHRAYGVDLNQTAVELAEVSLWLNVMHRGLQAPWFGLHLRRGNSLIGGRRAVYNLAALARKKENYWTTVPTDRPLHDADGGGGISEGEVHHFLLPAAGWGAVGDAKQAKELAPDRAEALRTWRKSMLHRPDKVQSERLRGLGKRVERMWELTSRRLEISEREVSRKIDIWGHDADLIEPTVTREKVESALLNPEGPYQRLRLVMDLWCSLFFWSASGEQVAPPTWEEWLDTLEDLIGLQGRAPRARTTVDDLSVAVNEFEALGDLDDNERVLFGMKRIAEVIVTRPWVGAARQVSEREGFAHWELDFAQVFGRGGFDLQVGNPPWVRGAWKDDDSLSEADPILVLSDRISASDRETLRDSILAVSRNRNRYLQDVADWVGAGEHLSSRPEHSILLGLQANLYVCFIERSWRSRSPGGIIGLLHPENHLVDPQAGLFRAACYRSLRRHWQFRNEAKLFEDIGNTREYGVCIYGADSTPKFLNSSHLQVPSTLEESFDAVGTGIPPGVKTSAGKWDRSPDRRRVISVDLTWLGMCGRVFDPPGTPALESRMIRMVTSDEIPLVKLLSDWQGDRMVGLAHHISRGWDEDKAKREKYIAWKTERRQSLSAGIIQGPQFAPATPLDQEPNPGCKNFKDYSPIDLVTLADNFVPRTNYGPVGTEGRYLAGLDTWDGRPYTSYWRTFWSRRIDTATERSLSSAVFPPGPAHVDAVHSLAMANNRLTTVVSGLWSSIPFDYLVKLSGMADLRGNYVNRFPFPSDHPAIPYILLRTLRLNCLIDAYAPLWNELFDESFAGDSWSDSFRMWPPLGVAGSTWTMDTPLRSEFERRAAMVEIDALAALALGLNDDELALMYTSQFGVLQKYEYTTWFDANGDKIAKEPHAKGVRQGRDDYNLLLAYNEGQDCGDLLSRYQKPFMPVNRVAEMRSAHAEFTERLGL